MKTVLLASLLMLVVILSGCQEQQVVWGVGDPPIEWQASFGNDNLARLNYVQSGILDRVQPIVYGLNIQDPNGKQTHKRGLIERVTALEDRVTILKELTTVLAKRLLRSVHTRKSKKKIRDDAVAAALILQGYLDEGQTM